MDAHQELLHTVHEHFRATGDWPQVRPLQVKLRHLGHLQKLAAEIGKDKILCDNPSPHGTCRLTLRGVAALEGEDSDIARLIHVVRALAKQSIESENGFVAISDLIIDLGLSDLEIRRLLELIRLTTGTWNGMSSGESGPIAITPGPYIWYYENIKSLDDYYAALQHAEDDQRSANEPGGDENPPPLTPPPAASAQSAALPDFVDKTRIEELRSLTPATVDLRRLIAMCEELNICSANGCVLATAMLTRAIIDHVPPIFGAKNFDEVANNYAGSKSFRDSMKHLTTSARSIADGHLHVQVRKKEVLPTRRQVDFSHDIDVLLSEIVRILS